MTSWHVSHAFANEMQVINRISLLEERSLRNPEYDGPEDMRTYVDEKHCLGNQSARKSLAEPSIWKWVVSLARPLTRSLTQSKENASPAQGG